METAISTTDTDSVSSTDSNTYWHAPLPAHPDELAPTRFSGLVNAESRGNAPAGTRELLAMDLPRWIAHLTMFIDDITAQLEAAAQSPGTDEEWARRADGARNRLKCLRADVEAMRISANVRPPTAVAALQRIGVIVDPAPGSTEAEWADEYAWDQIVSVVKGALGA